MSMLILAAVFVFVAWIAPIAWRRWCFVRKLDRLPGPIALPVIGTIWKYIGYERNQIRDRMREISVQYPGIMRHWMGSRGSVDFKRAEHFALVLGSDPRQAHGPKNWQYHLVKPWLGDGLLTSDTTREWQRHRKMITPAFNFAMLETFTEIFAEHSSQLATKLEHLAKEHRGNVITIYPQVTLCTLDAIAEAAMGTKLGLQAIGEQSEYARAVYDTTAMIIERGMTPWLHADWVYALTARGKHFKSSVRVMHDFTESVIAGRRKERAQEQATKTPNESTTNGGRKRLALLDLLLDRQQEENLTDREIREEVDTFMFAGHDTTTANISWTIWLLAHHPEVQQQIYDELLALFGEADISNVEGRPAKMSDLQELKYLERVIKESLRLYPSAPIIGRRLTETLIVDGYEIPAGTEVELHIHELHRDERYFPDADRFDPDRFLPENIQNRPAFAYVPFSSGSRNCIGQKFAMLQELSVLSTLCRRMRFTVPIGSKIDDEKQLFEVTVKPSRGVQVFVELR